MNSPPDEDFRTADDYFNEDEKQRIKNLKILSARKRGAWQEEHLEH